jgi:vancomycin permeability regulator SanA
MPAGAAAASTVIAVTAARVFAASRRQRATQTGHESADAAIIFGGQAFVHGPGGELTARLNHGLALWRDGIVPVLAVSGGPSGDVDEIRTMHHYLHTNGVPQSAILDLRPGDNTRITLRSAAASPLANQRLIGVSTRYHAHRIEAEARRRGLVLRADCPADSPEMRNPDALWVRYLSEVIGCVVYASPEWLEHAMRRVAGQHRHTAASSLIRQSRRLRRWHRQQRRSRAGKP